MADANDSRCPPESPALPEGPTPRPRATEAGDRQGEAPMSRRRAFRPQVSEYLEDRVVPSPAGASQATVVLGRTVPSLPQLPDGDRVRAAFDDFVRGYTRAVQLVLLAPGPDGSVNPSANRAAFDAV